MDGNRFDELARALAERSNRRDAVRRGGVLAAVAGAFGLGGARAFAQDDDDDNGDDDRETRRCQLAFRSVVVAGPNEEATFDGLLTLQIAEDGAIDGGTLETDGGRPYRVVGQAVGRALSLRVEISDDRVLALSGVGERDIRDCRGPISGTFAGPEFGDLGAWEAERRRSSTPTPSPDEDDIVDDPAGSGSGSGSSGDGGGDGSSGGGDADDTGSSSGPCIAEVCAPPQTFNDETCACECPGGGELCGDICCPVGGVCDEAGGSCQCPPGTILCGQTCVPECAPGSTLNGDTCVCDEGCPSGQVLCGGACVGPCGPNETLNTTTCVCDPLCPAGQQFCGGMCIDVVNDAANCGSCGNVCPPGMPCIAGSCLCPATTKYCPGGTANTPAPMCKDENAIC